MALTSRMKILVATLVVAFAISGCQSSGKWMAWNDRAKPKEQFKDPNDTEEVTYWPYRSVKNKKKMSPVPSQLQEKVAQRSAQSKQDAELTELLNEGDVLRRKNQMENARLVYQKALALSPDNADVHRRLAIVADMQGNFSVADEHYQITLRLRPRDVDILSDQGYSYMLRGNNVKAEMALREALLIDPNHKKAMGNLGAIYARQNRYAEALAMYRAGCTETEAQQNIAQLFPQGRDLAMVSGTQDAVQSNVSPAVASSMADNPADLSKLSLKEIQAKMARLAMEAKQRRYEADQRELAQYRSLSAGESLDAQQAVAAQQSATQSAVPHPGMARGSVAAGTMAVGPRGTDNTPFNHPSAADTIQRQGVELQAGLNGSTQDMAAQSNAPPMNPRSPSQDRSLATPGFCRETEIFRGPSSATQPGRPTDPQIQRAWNPQFAGPVGNNAQQPPPNNIQQTNDLTSSQMATQLGMSVGPGTIFPAPPSTGAGGLPPNAVESRFGSEFPEAPAYQNQQSGSGLQNDQRRGANANSTDEGLTIGPPSPANNWGTGSMATGSNGQNGSADSSAWSNELQSANAPSNGFEQPGFQSSWGQIDRRRSSDGFDRPQQGMNSANRYRNGNDASRPYNGAWPSSNSTPPRQNQPIPSNGGNVNNLDTFGGGLMNADGFANPANQNGSLGNGSGNSLPQWPDAPRR